jgi:transcriptional regulator with XRE-family HTH domain
MTLLRELRKERCLSMADLCRARGLNLGRMSEVETGKAAPSKHMRRELARFYHMDEAELFGADGFAR